MLRPVYRPGVGHICLLATLGLVAMGMTGIETAAGERAASRQMIFVPVGLLVAMIAAMVHYRRFAEWATPLSLLTLGLLVLVLFTPMRKGARRWLDLGPVDFQPSEAAKIVYVIALAAWLRFRENYRTLRGLAVPLVMTFVPMGLILIEPDLGTAMVFLPVMFAMLIAAGAKLRHILLILVIGMAAMPAMYPLLQPHQKARIHDVVARMTGDTKHAQTISFQGRTATTLIGAGQLTGHDPEHASQLVEYNGLPEGHNDMIFSVVCTRFGLAGGTMVLGLYGMLLTGGVLVAAQNKDPFARLMTVGIVAILFTQIFVNIGMNIGLLPITGLPLPMMSAGGSSLVVNFAMVGLMMNGAGRRPVVISRPAFEFDTIGERRGDVLRK